MPLIEVNWDPPSRQLRQFGVVSLFALPALGWLCGAPFNVAGWLAAFGAALAVSGMLAPQLLRPLFLVLTIITTPVRLLIAELAMLLIYFVVFVPIGLVSRLARRDALKLSCDRRVTSHWRPKSRPHSAASYFGQF